jgi:hypothetical protein
MPPGERPVVPDPWRATASIPFFPCGPVTRAAQVWATEAGRVTDPLSINDPWPYLPTTALAPSPRLSSVARSARECRSPAGRDPAGVIIHRPHVCARRPCKAPQSKCGIFRIQLRSRPKPYASVLRNFRRHKQFLPHYWKGLATELASAGIWPKMLISNGFHIQQSRSGCA